MHPCSVQSELTCADEPSSVENEYATASVVERDLDCRESFGCVVRVRQPGGDGVQVERQLEAAAGHRDGLRQPAQRSGMASCPHMHAKGIQVQIVRDDIDEAWHKVQNLRVVGER